jgi:hypothetical protein
VIYGLLDPADGLDSAASIGAEELKASALTPGRMDSPFNEDLHFLLGF